MPESGPFTSRGLTVINDRFSGPVQNNTLEVVPDRFSGPIVQLALQVVTVQVALRKIGDDGTPERFDEITDEALLSRIEGTLASRQLWADVAATLVQIGNGGGNAVMQLLAGANEDLIFGARGQQLPFNDPANLNLSGFSASSVIGALNENRSDITSLGGGTFTMQHGGTINSITQRGALYSGVATDPGTAAANNPENLGVMPVDAEIIAIAITGGAAGDLVTFRIQGGSDMTLDGTGAFDASRVADGFVPGLVANQGQVIAYEWAGGTDPRIFSALTLFRQV